MTVTESAASTGPSTSGLPSRLHHTAYVVRDQNATRAFYEGIIGLPLMATWCEIDELFGAERVYCHTFYGLGDGSALAFFQFEKDSDYAEFGPQFRPSPFIHIALKVDEATQQGIEGRLQAAGTDHFVLEHGYCRSLYTTDPDGLILEFTLDHPEADSINALRAKLASADLQRWLAGDHSSNNDYRPA